MKYEHLPTQPMQEEVPPMPDAAKTKKDNAAFAANLALLRRNAGLSQEQLAEKLDVSRQSVSKWESGLCLPELATLDALCGLFGCTLDLLLRGDAARMLQTDLAAYDAEYDRFTRAVTAGVGVMLSALTLAAAAYAANWPEQLYGAAFMLGAAGALMLFIPAGIQHEAFRKKHPPESIEYPPERREEVDRQFPYRVSGSAGLLVVSLALAALLQGLVPTNWLGVLFLALLTAAGVNIVHAGMQRARFDEPERVRRLLADPALARRERRLEKAHACLWIGAILLFVVWGRLGDAWQIAWVVFPAAVLGSGLLAVLLREPGDE